MLFISFIHPAYLTLAWSCFRLQVIIIWCLRAEVQGKKLKIVHSIDDFLLSCSQTTWTSFLLRRSFTRLLHIVNDQPLIAGKIRSPCWFIAEINFFVDSTKFCSSFLPLAPSLLTHFWWHECHMKQALNVSSSEKFFMRSTKCVRSSSSSLTLCR